MRGLSINVKHRLRFASGAIVALAILVGGGLAVGNFGSASAAVDASTAKHISINSKDSSGNSIKLKNTVLKLTFSSPVGQDQIVGSASTWSCDNPASARITTDGNTATFTTNNPSTATAYVCLDSNLSTNVTASLTAGGVQYSATQTINGGNSNAITFNLAKVVPLTVAPDKEVIVSSLDNWDTTNTNTAGSNIITKSGLNVLAGGNGKAAGYLKTENSYPLSVEAARGTTADSVLAVSGTGTAPSAQLAISIGGVPVGYLVGETIYGQDFWWFSSYSSTNFPTKWADANRTPVVGLVSSMGYCNTGSLAAFAAALPADTTVTAIGYSLGTLGADQAGNYVIQSLTLGGVKYIFQLAADTEQPTVTPSFSDGATMSKADAANISFQFNDNVGLAKYTINRGQIVNGTCQTGSSAAFKNFGGTSAGEQNLTASANSADLSSGQYCFKLAATDTSGNQLKNSDKNGLIIVKFSIDNDAPIVALNNPQNGNFINGNTKFSITATDNQSYDSGVARVIAHFTDAAGNVCYPDKNGLSGDAYTYEFTLSESCAGKLQDGQITLKYSAIDAVQNGAKVQVANFVLDTAAPALESVKINGQVVAENQTITLAGSDPVSFEITVSDANIKDIYAKLQTPTSVQIGDNVKNTDGSNTVKWTVPASAIVDGKYMFWIPATDQAGNAANLTFYFNVDSTAPTLSNIHIESSNPNHNLAKVGDTITVSYDVSEKIAGGMYAAIRFGGDNASLGGNTNDVCTLNDDGVTYHCVQTYTVKAGDLDGQVKFFLSGYFDVANNAGATYDSDQGTDGSSVTIDTTAPTVSQIWINGQDVTGQANPTIDTTGQTDLAFKVCASDANLKGIYANAQVDVGDTHVGETAHNGDDGTTCVEWTIPAAQLANVAHELWIQLTDLAGNSFNTAFQFTPIIFYTVTFDGDGVAPQTVAAGLTATKPEDPTRENYTFGGWYGDAEFTTEFNFDTAITGDLMLYAKWTAVVSPENPEPPVVPPTNEQNNQEGNNPTNEVSNVAVTTPISRNANTVQTTPANSTGTVAVATAATNDTTPTDSAASNTSAAETNQTSTNQTSGGEVLGARDSKSWSILNLILAALTVFISVVTLIAWFGGDKNSANRHGALRILTLLPAIGAAVIFLAVEDWTLSMQFVNSWTWLMATIFAVQIILSFAATRRRPTPDGNRKVRLAGE